MSGEEKASNSSDDRKKRKHDELVEYYKKKYNGNTRLAEMIVKIIEAQDQYNCEKKGISPLQLIRDYPDAIKAIAMAKIAVKFASEGSDVKKYKNYINDACAKLKEAIELPGLPVYLVKYIQALHESTLTLIPSKDDGKVSEDERNAAEALEEAYPDIIEYLVDIDKTLQSFLRKFEAVALKNERASRRNACCSKWLSIIAIAISAIGIFANAGIQWYFASRTEKNDKMGELIEVVKKSHPWHDQQISSEETKNVSIAFRSVTTAMQENAQNRHEISRLQTELKKTHDRLGEIQNKYDKMTSVSTQTQKQLQREIDSLKGQIASLQREATSLKMQIEELKKPSVSKTVPTAPEAKK